MEEDTTTPTTGSTPQENVPKVVGEGEGEQDREEKVYGVSIGHVDGQGPPLHPLVHFDERYLVLFAAHQIDLADIVWIEGRQEPLYYYYNGMIRTIGVDPHFHITVKVRGNNERWYLGYIDTRDQQVYPFLRLEREPHD